MPPIDEAELRMPSASGKPNPASRPETTRISRVRRSRSSSSY